MRSDVLLAIGLVGLPVLSGIWIVALLNERVRWRSRYAQAYMLLLLLTAWQLVWHEVNFEFVLLGVTGITCIFWVIARMSSITTTQRSRIGPIGSYAPLLLAVLLVRSFWYEPFQIPSASMRPTLEVGDFLLVNKFAYSLHIPGTKRVLLDIGRRPERGDIVVFDPPGISRRYIKRVIGIPGDSVAYRNRELWINGERLPLTNVRHDEGARILTEQLSGCRQYPVRFHTRRGADLAPTKVPDGYYLMLGDNRDNSSDSRVWGLVPFERIYGRAEWRWIFWPSLFSLPSFHRFGRINPSCEKVGQTSEQA